MYKTHKSLNVVGTYTATVKYEDENGSVFICDCGDWESIDSIMFAQLIARLLNEDANKLM